MNVCLDFCFTDILWHASRGRNQAWLSVCKLTVGHRGVEEEGPEVPPCLVKIGQLCVRETRVNRAVWSHRAALIKDVSLSLLSVSNILSVSLCFFAQLSLAD